MATTIPCPNPTCTHSFSQAELQSASQLVCPKCSFRMQGKGPANPKPAPAPKAAAPTPVPIAKVLTPAKPAASEPKPNAKPLPATPVQATAVVADPPPAPASVPETSNDALTFDNEPLVRLPTKKGKFNWGRFAIFSLITGIAACVVVVAFVSVFLILMGTGALTDFSMNPDDVHHTGAVRDAKGNTEKAYKLILNRKEWAVDNEMAATYGAHMAWKHTERDFWFAVVVKDHAVYKPRDAEMLRYALEKLEGHFGEALELGGKAEPVKMCGLPAQRIQFKGQIKAANWLGECYMFFKEGVAFWLFISSPDWDVVERYAGVLPEKHMSVLVDRRGWREQPPATETYASLNNQVKVTVPAMPKGIWEKHNAKNEDENGELFLFGRFLKGEKDNRKNASLLVFTLEKKPDLGEALKSARDYLDNKVKNENNNFKIVPAEEVAEGKGELKTLDVGNRRGRIADLKLQFNEEPKRYYLLAIVNEPDNVYATLCECSWESRQIWRQEFLEVLGAMKFQRPE